MKIFGIITIVLGALAMMMPWVAGESIVLMVGLLVIAGGVARMFWAFRTKSLGKGILVFLIGVLTLAAGVAVIAHPVLTSAILTIVLAVYFVMDGVSELIVAIAMPSGATGKGWLMFDGVVTIALGVLIFSGYPLGGTVAIGIFLGIKLLLVGFTMLTLGSKVQARAAA